MTELLPMKGYPSVSKRYRVSQLIPMKTRYLENGITHRRPEHIGDLFLSLASLEDHSKVSARQMILSLRYT